MGDCVPGCAAPLAICDGGQCVDPRNDPAHCGGCDQFCPPGQGALPACAANVCVPGPCAPGFDDCNGLPGDGCEAQLGNDSANCGGCNVPCTASESCVFGQCCGPLPPGSYQLTCNGCEACGGLLRCICDDMAQFPTPTAAPLGCPTNYLNCNGVLKCDSC